jgi:citrate synthase
MKELHRRTAISWAESNRILVRGYRIEDLIGTISFGAAAYLILTGALPNETEHKLFEAVLVSVIDHGPTPPSTVATTTVATTGAALSSGVAAGILAIARYHGGAIEDCMNLLEACIGSGSGPADAARKWVAQSRAEKNRLPGFGHRQHEADPRVARLFALARQLGVEGLYVAQAEEVARALSEALGRPISLNADGAIATVLCEMRFPRDAANGLFMIARVPGLVAHFMEEQRRNPPMRSIDVNEYEYDGFEERSLKE